MPSYLVPLGSILIPILVIDVIIPICFNDVVMLATFSVAHGRAVGEWTFCVPMSPPLQIIICTTQGAWCSRPESAPAWVIWQALVLPCSLTRVRQKEKERFFLVRAVLVILLSLVVFLASCGGGQPAEQQQEPAENQPPTQENTEEMPETTAGQATTAAQSTIKCEDFTTQVQAQGFYDEVATESEREALDPDGNGVACEELPPTAEDVPAQQ